MKTSATGGGYRGGDKDIFICVEVDGVPVRVRVDCDDVPLRAAKVVAKGILDAFNARPKRGRK